MLSGFLVFFFFFFWGGGGGEGVFFVKGFYKGSFTGFYMVFYITGVRTRFFVFVMVLSRRQDEN